ncbi:MAG: hypothetical protein Q8Q20_04260 [bacterium]|nr:hypothetical protein [bacterium]
MSSLSQQPKGFAVTSIVIGMFIIVVATFSGLFWLYDRGKSIRDNERMEEMEKVAVALETYYHKYGEYPQGEGFSTDARWGGVDAAPGNPLGVLVDEGFLADLPRDPINEETGCDCGNGYRYYYCFAEEGSGTECLRSNADTHYSVGGFHLSACLETGESECAITCNGVTSPVGNTCFGGE